MFMGFSDFRDALMCWQLVPAEYWCPYGMETFFLGPCEWGEHSPPPPPPIIYTSVSNGIYRVIYTKAAVTVVQWVEIKTCKPIQVYIHIPFSKPLASPYNLKYSYRDTRPPQGTGSGNNYCMQADELMDFVVCMVQTFDSNYL